jgi:hypothetical protein
MFFVQNEGSKLHFDDLSVEIRTVISCLDDLTSEPHVLIDLLLSQYSWFTFAMHQYLTEDGVATAKQNSLSSAYVSAVLRPIYTVHFGCSSLMNHPK